MPSLSLRILPRITEEQQFIIDKGAQRASIGIFRLLSFKPSVIERTLIISSGYYPLSILDIVHNLVSLSMFDLRASTTAAALK